MAGETEDCITFEADSLPTGSISFGRFELESLSWERRSSFSHNRYLEEVEKYSTPGSVTEKKAYFEAHFKKKALLLQTSSENQNEDEITGNEIDDHTSYMEEFVGHDNGGQLEFSWYDVTPAVSEEHEIIECEEEKQEETLTSAFPLEPTPSNNERPSYHDEKHQTRSGFYDVPSEKDNLAILVEEKSENKAVIVEKLIDKREISSASPMVEKKNSPSLKTQRASLEVKETVAQRTAKTKLSTKLPAQQGSRNLSAERRPISSVKMSTKFMEKVERPHTLKTKSVKQSPLRTPTPAFSDSKSLKLEASENLKPKLKQEIRSEKDLRAKKMPHPISEKSQIEVCQPAHRPKRFADSTKAEVNQSGAIFNFKSDERAEKRKEYYMKLEEKLHAKEAEMNAIQARTQEETEAEIKQFRRSLNFKASPMPSFYQEAAPKISEGKKVAPTPAKSLKMRSKCTSPGNKSSSREKSPVFANASNHENPSTHGPNQASESTKKSEVGEKEERSRLDVHQQQQGGNGRQKKGESVNRWERGGKVTKGGSIVSGSVAVHVAS